MNINEIYLQKKLKIVLPGKIPINKINNRRLIATINKNLESLGYRFSKTLFDTLSQFEEQYISKVYQEIIPILKKMRGAHRVFKPMYPNFPKQVIEASDFELYFNALVHYWSFVMVDNNVIDNTILPDYEKKERLPLTEKVKYDIIDLGGI